MKMFALTGITNLTICTGLKITLLYCKIPDSLWLMWSFYFFTYKCAGERNPSHWNSLRRLTVEKSALSRQLGLKSSSTDLLSSTPPTHQLSHQLSGGGLNQSASAVYDSVVKGKNPRNVYCFSDKAFEDNCTNGIETINEYQRHQSTTARTHSSLVSPRTCCSPELHSHTAPSSPFHQRHHSTNPSLLSTKQHSLDELKSTVHTVASGMKQNTSDVRELKQKMVAVTEKITDSVEENAQALSLLVEVVDKLQGLIIARKIPHVACASRSQNISKTASVPNSPCLPRVPAKKHFSSVSATRPHILSTSSSSSTASSCSSTSLNACVDVHHSELKSSSSNQTPGNKNAKTSLSNGLAVSRSNDESDTILCLSRKKKKSKMKK